MPTNYREKNQIGLSDDITQGISSGINCCVKGRGNPRNIGEVKYLMLSGNG